MLSARLSGKTALVTGGASGIGAAITDRFRLEGARVYVADIACTDGEQTINLDVRDESAVEAAASRVVSEAGRLDICIANAGISPTIDRTVDLELETWQYVLEINLTGVFLTLRAGARRMLDGEGGGRLIATTSVAGIAGESGASAYCTSKFGLRGLVESMALELASDGITVNAVAPGEVDTPLHASLRELYARERSDRVEEAGTVGEKTGYDIRRELEARIPMHRMATPTEIAGAYAYLASDEAAYITGTVLLMDGGQLLV